MTDLTRLFALMDEADEALDQDTYEQKRSVHFDVPDDVELMIRAETDRKIGAVFAEIDRIRRERNAI